MTVGWLSFDILLFDDGFGVVGIGDAWMVILARNITGNTVVAKFQLSSILNCYLHYNHHETTHPP